MQEAKMSHATISPWQFHDETVAIDQNRNQFFKAFSDQNSDETSTSKVFLPLHSVLVAF
jgi:hypothetical protein